MRTAAEYFAKAEELAREAEQTADVKERANLLSSARTWREVGADAELQEQIIAERYRVQ